VAIGECGLGMVGDVGGWVCDDFIDGKVDLKKSLAVQALVHVHIIIKVPPLVLQILTGWSSVPKRLSSGEVHLFSTGSLHVHNFFIQSMGKTQICVQNQIEIGLNLCCQL